MRQECVCCGYVCQILQESIKNSFACILGLFRYATVSIGLVVSSALSTISLLILSNWVSLTDVSKPLWTSRAEVHSLDFIESCFTLYTRDTCTDLYLLAVTPRGAPWVCPLSQLPEGSILCLKKKKSTKQAVKFKSPFVDHQIGESKEVWSAINSTKFCFTGLSNQYLFPLAPVSERRAHVSPANSHFYVPGIT